MEHRLQQELAHFETSIASFRGLQTLHYEAVATHIFTDCKCSQQVQYFHFQFLNFITKETTWRYAFFYVNSWPAWHLPKHLPAAYHPPFCFNLFPLQISLSLSSFSLSRSRLSSSSHLLMAVYWWYQIAGGLTRLESGANGLSNVLLWIQPVKREEIGSDLIRESHQQKKNVFKKRVFLFSACLRAIWDRNFINYNQPNVLAFLCTKLIRFPWIILISSSVFFSALALFSFPFLLSFPISMCFPPSRAESNTASFGWMR